MMYINTMTGINPFALGMTYNPVFVYDAMPAFTGLIPFGNLTGNGIDISQYFGSMPMIPQTEVNISALVQDILGSIKTPSFDSIKISSKPVQTESQGKADTVDDSQDVGEVSQEGMFLKGKGKGTKYGPEFLKKVKRIAKNLNCNYRDLLAIFNSEFGVEANKTASNGAVGLICFMPQYFDTKKIVQMSPIDQLDVVEQTIMKAKKMAGFSENAKLSKADLYALVFLPARAGKEVLCQRGEGNKFYESNAALDYNHDGKITKTEMAHRIDRKYVSDQSFLA